MDGGAAHTEQAVPVTPHAASRNVTQTDGDARATHVHHRRKRTSLVRCGGSSGVASPGVARVSTASSQRQWSSGFAALTSKWNVSTSFSTVIHC